MRYGDWKLCLLGQGQFTEDEKQNMKKSSYGSVQYTDRNELYNLRNDPGELHDVSEKYPEIVDKILQMADKEKRAFGQYPDKGPEVRKTLFIESPERLVK